MKFLLFFSIEPSGTSSLFHRAHRDLTINAYGKDTQRIFLGVRDANRKGRKEGFYLSFLLSFGGGGYVKIAYFIMKLK
jgi:hypothetical protein